MKRVTCIVPTYNSERTIVDTLASIRRQTYPSIDIIVSDDCSTDHTLELALKTLDQRPSIPFRILMSDRNSGGPNNGKNRALDVATGDYITFCDHDDLLAPTKFAEQVSLMEKMGCHVCSTGRQNINVLTGDQQDFIGYKGYYEKNEVFFTALAPDYNRQKTYCIMAGIMIDKSLAHYRFENLYGVAEFSWVLDIYHNRDSCEVMQPLSIRMLNGRNFSLSPVYRYKDFICKRQMFLMYEEQYPREVRACRWKYEGSEGRYYYLMGDYKRARSHFLRARPSLKILAYYVSSFICPGFVKRHFHIFG